MKCPNLLIMPLLLAGIVFGLVDCNETAVPDPLTEAEYAQAREQMVTSQIEARGINNERLSAAMRKVPRHRFIPTAYRAQAYADLPLPIGDDQTISQPYIVGLMTQHAALDANDKVLEIGTGSGYQAAILGELCNAVYTVEIVKPLAERSADLLDSLGYDNVSVRRGDGYAGWPEQAPFDAILVTCAPPEIPQPLIDQLAEGGRLVIPVGDWQQELQVLTRQGDSIVTSSVIAVRFVPMTGDGIKSQEKDN
ncbi:MAG: protein-L-isoaspartate(D-aspartate) O-methyltransferase [bacterium]